MILCLKWSFKLTIHCLQFLLLVRPWMDFWISHQWVHILMWRISKLRCFSIMLYKENVQHYCARIQYINMGPTPFRGVNLPAKPHNAVQPGTTHFVYSSRNYRQNVFTTFWKQKRIWILSLEHITFDPEQMALLHIYLQAYFQMTTGS